MAYTGNASVVYGASDLAPARKLFSDWGLKSVKRGNTAQVLETGVGGEVFPEAGVGVFEHGGSIARRA